MEDNEDEDVAARANDALRRALNTPPKQHKDMKKGKGKKRQDEPTASGDARAQPERTPE